jgi:hypothetical protein
MASINLELDEELGAGGARAASGTSGARVLGLERIEFIRRASDLGIPYFRLTEDEWQTEAAESKRR